MRFLILLLGLPLIAVATVLAQEAEPTPSASVPQTTATPSELNEQTPNPSPTPETQEPPQLLPESKTLPAQPDQTPLLRDLIPPGPKPLIPGTVPNPTSAEQLEKDKVRFRQLRTIAVRDPYAIYLLRRARSERTDEMKREYLRVYYISMCDQMRRLEPRLKPMIDIFENANVVRLSQNAVRPTVPGRDVPRFDASQRIEKAH
jgi:hypothetical protein